MRGGLSRRSTNGRLTRTRRISSIRLDVKLNSELWNLAERYWPASAVDHFWGRRCCRRCLLPFLTPPEMSLLSRR